VIWPDAFGLRPSIRDIAKRLASEGYSVLVPNPFYRVAKAPVFEDVSNFNFGKAPGTVQSGLGVITGGRVGDSQGALSR
jgi:dienelactone hydrolase